MEEDGSKVPESLDMSRTPPDLPSPVSNSGMPSTSSSKASSVAGEMTGNLDDDDFLDDPSYIKVGNGTTTEENLNNTTTSVIDEHTTTNDDTESRSSFSIVDANSSFESSENVDTKDETPHQSQPMEASVNSNPPIVSPRLPETQQSQSGSSLMNYFGMASTADDFLKSSPPTFLSGPVEHSNPENNNQSRPTQLPELYPSQNIGSSFTQPCVTNEAMPADAPPINQNMHPGVVPMATFPQSNMPLPVSPHTPLMANSIQTNPMMPPGITPTTAYSQDMLGHSSIPSSPSTLSMPNVPQSNTMMPHNVQPAAPGFSSVISAASHSPLPAPTLPNATTNVNANVFPPPIGQFEELSLNNKSPMTTQLFNPTQQQCATPVGYATSPSPSQPMSNQMPIQPHLPTYSNNPSTLAGPPNVFNNSPAPTNSIPAPFVPPVYSPSPNTQPTSPQIFTPQQPTPTYNTSSQGCVGDYSSNQPTSMPGMSHQSPMTTPKGYNTYEAPSPTMSRSQYDLEDSQGSDDDSSGFWNWIKMTVTSVNPQRLGQQLLQKTKVATDTVLTTLDPGMEEYLRPVVNLAIDSRTQDVAQGLRQGFRSVFGHTVARGKDVSHSLPPLIIGLDNGLAALEQKFGQLSQVNFEFSGCFAMLACEVVVAEFMPQQWFAVYLLGLRDMSNNIQLNSLSQPITVPPSCVQSIMHYRDNYNQMAYHPTWEDIVYGYKQNSNNQDWCSILSGIPKQALLTIASQSLAASYKQCLDALRESNLGQQYSLPHS